MGGFIFRFIHPSVRVNIILTDSDNGPPVKLHVEESGGWKGDMLTVSAVARHCEYKYMHVAVCVHVHVRCVMRIHALTLACVCVRIRMHAFNVIPLYMRNVIVNTSICMWLCLSMCMCAV